ncbi:MAG: hypothetical protein ACO1SV_26690 [Fimbriimonas sp.]
MRTDTAGQRIARNAAGLVSSVTNRVKIARKDRAEAAARAAGPTVQERQDDLVRFYERYEELVETLCDSAQYGPTPKLERSYAGHREWMLGVYPGVRPFVIAFLRREPEDEAFGVEAAGQPTDAFEALVVAEDLGRFLQIDDGGMISRITRTREALNLYGEHLRQLAARTA